MRTTSLLRRNGRTFKVEHGLIGEARGWIPFERDLEPGISWSCIGGAFRTKGEVYAYIDSWATQS